jgi:hypothetical protein
MKRVILLIAMLIVLFAGAYETSNLKRANMIQKETIDSLRDELFIKHTTLCRYEMTLELLYQQDKLAAAKFDSIYNNETE